MAIQGHNHPPLPLSGVRVLELAEGWAGPQTGMWLGDMGAEVIKVEAMQRFDHARGPVSPPDGLASYPNKTGGPRPYDVNAPYVQGNRNKLSITIDLARPKGVGIFKRLVPLADVVFTNMVTGVPEKMGIGYEVLSKLRSDLIMLMISGYGTSGPYARRVTMGGAMDGIAGYTWLRHYPDQTPDTVNYSMHTDVVTGQNNAMAVLMALYQRNRTGDGQLIESSGVEASLHQIHGSLMDYAMNGRIQTSRGNGHPAMAPHGVYPCAGEDRWIAITVATDAQWRALAEVMGRPAWAAGSRFATAVSRWTQQDRLNESLAEWTRTQSSIDLMHRLQEARVPAGAVHDAAEHAQDPHWKKRGFYQEVRLGNYGTYPIGVSPWIVDGQRLGVRRHPPGLGEHNEHVLGGILGLSHNEIEGLRAEQYIGEEPLAQIV